MKNATLALSSLLVMAVTTLAAQTAAVKPAASPAASGTRRTRVAVLDFDYATVYSNASAIFGRNVDIGKGITDLLVTYLVKDGSYSVIERKALDKIMTEQNFSNSDRADPTSAAKIGKLLGVDAIIVGSITQFGNDTKNTGVGGAGAGLGKLGIGKFGQKESKAIVELGARLVNVDTGEILAAVDGHGESKRKSTSIGGAGGGWGGFGGGTVDFGNSNFQDTIIGEAVKAAVEDASAKVIGERSRVAVRAVTVQGLVAAVAGKQIILNVGTKAGVKVGDRLNVLRSSGPDIKDPATGKAIHKMTTEVGVVKVVEVDEDSSVAEAESGTVFKISDIVKSVSEK
jgi:curli biogenesis system outer membrane secretion channel CsgG